jgi:hypothetical protein
MSPNKGLQVLEVREQIVLRNKQLNKQGAVK